MNNVVIIDKNLASSIDKNQFDNQISNNRIISLDDYLINSSINNNVNYFVFIPVELFFISFNYINFVKKIINDKEKNNFNVILINIDGTENEIVKKWFEKIKKYYNLNLEVVSQISQIDFLKKSNQILDYIFNENGQLKDNSIKIVNLQNKYKKTITIYTDGACSGNPGAGGWGAVLICGETKKEISGFEKETTNNKMELTAVIEALSNLKTKCDVELYSDSAYVVNAIKLGWLENWKNNNWIGSDRKPVKNIELWQKLDKLLALHSVNFNKVKGHSDNEMNNRCDELATGEIAKHNSSI